MNTRMPSWRHATTTVAVAIALASCSKSNDGGVSNLSLSGTLSNVSNSIISGRFSNPFRNSIETLESAVDLSALTAICVTLASPPVSVTGSVGADGNIWGGVNTVGVDIYSVR